MIIKNYGKSNISQEVLQDFLNDNVNNLNISLVNDLLLFEPDVLRATINLLRDGRIHFGDIHDIKQLDYNGRVAFLNTYIEPFDVFEVNDPGILLDLKSESDYMTSILGIFDISINAYRTTGSVVSSYDIFHKVFSGYHRKKITYKDIAEIKVVFDSLETKVINEYINTGTLSGGENVIDKLPAVYTSGNNAANAGLSEDIYRRIFNEYTLGGVNYLETNNLHKLMLRINDEYAVGLNRTLSYHLINFSIDNTWVNAINDFADVYRQDQSMKRSTSGTYYNQWLTLDATDTLTNGSGVLWDIITDQDDLFDVNPKVWINKLYAAVLLAEAEYDTGTGQSGNELAFGTVVKNIRIELEDIFDKIVFFSMFVRDMSEQVKSNMIIY